MKYDNYFTITTVIYFKNMHLLEIYLYFITRHNYTVPRKLLA